MNNKDRAEAFFWAGLACFGASLVFSITSILLLIL